MDPKQDSLVLYSEIFSIDVLEILFENKNKDKNFILNFNLTFNFKKHQNNQNNFIQVGSNSAYPKNNGP